MKAENTHNQNSIAWQTISACLITLILLAVSGCDQKSNISNDSTQLPHTIIEGPLSVSYEIQTSDNSFYSNGDKPTTAKEIILYENYIIVNNINGTSQILPVDRIKRANWQKIEQ